MSTADRPSSPNRVGIVLLVLIGGVLIALVLCSRSVWLETRDRIECTNNLRQLGMALHSYDATNNCLPTEDGGNPSFYETILSYVQGGAVDRTRAGMYPVRLYLCPARRTAEEAPGKRDYGYAVTPSQSGSSVLNCPEGLSLTAFSNRSGNFYPLVLSHIWMSPSDYAGGDPTDAGWVTKNNSRPNNQTAKRDSDSTGNTSYIGGPHRNALPSLFLDGHVQSLPYDYLYWAELWNVANTTSFPRP